MEPNELKIKRDLENIVDTSRMEGWVETVPYNYLLMIKRATEIHLTTKQIAALFEIKEEYADLIIKKIKLGTCPRLIEFGPHKT